MRTRLTRLLKYVVYATAFNPLAVLAASPPPPPPSPVDNGAGNAHAAGTPNDLFTPTGVFHTIADVLIFIIGAVAVIMLIIGGFRYVVSQGDPGATKSAKDTILYAIVGIVVAIMAYAIVHFVATAFNAS